MIALSGHTDGLSRAAALEAGASAFVTKSEAFDELVATILTDLGARVAAGSRRYPPHAAPID